MLNNFFNISLLSIVLSTNPVEMNIVETAVSNDSFSTLVAAVQAADLVDALSSDGPFTVFAPT
ncbi:MAG: fasciclin domain-containing protein, partial [Bacteroidota bacterium]|nr:fasciclin domain-containing protein [Bacteroidota bacterium]